MSRVSGLSVIAALPVLVAACGQSPPRETRVIIQQPAQPATVTMAPAPPPAPHAELVQPPPQGSGPVVWQPGHWLYTGIAGNEWSWQPGHYMAPPPGESTWVPGYWSRQPTGQWEWIEGHWA